MLAHLLGYHNNASKVQMSQEIQDCMLTELDQRQQNAMVSLAVQAIDRALSCSSWLQELEQLVEGACRLLSSASVSSDLAHGTVGALLRVLQHVVNRGEYCLGIEGSGLPRP